MPRREKYDLKTVAQIVDSEGLRYAITSYMNETRIADKKLAKLWKQARVVLEKIEAMLPDPHEDGADD